ncbi:unannotated protein [freshwater metagenome]|uniref:Unannotated protein n=1 Tax=freshwater metagenome TaxID=449393 RepID=A0A6J7UDX0_9ZZZZ
MSDPIRLALTIKLPLLLIDPANTKSFMATSTGVASPVKNELLIVLNPDTTWPSVGIESPGFITNRSPTTRSSIEITDVEFPRFTSTVPADNLNNSASAEPALCFALCSKYRPSMTKKITADETSA